MTAEALHILDERDPTRGPFFIAVGLHVALFGGLTVFSLVSGRDRLGAPDAGGAAVGVEAVKSIPLPHSGPKNPVANDTESETPQAPAKKETVRQRDDKEAIPVKMRDKKDKVTAPKPPRFRSFEEIAQNQITNAQAQATSSAAFTAMPGAGRVGTGANTTIGNRFPEYAARIQQIIAQKWRTNDVEARVKTAPAVVATFEIMRDGSVRGFSLQEKSNISSLDFSVERAILDSSPFPPLPREFDRNSARVELWFELKR